MALITRPSILQLDSIKPRIVQPAQQNRSLWTGKSKIIGLSGCEYWTGQGAFRVLATEAGIRTARAFFFGLRGKVNTFDFPVTPTPQIVLGVTYPVIANRNNTTVSAQPGNVTRITKTGGVSGAYDASAVEAFVGTAGDFVLEVKPGGGAINAASVGMNADPNTDDSYASIDFQVFCTGGQYYVYQGASQIGGGHAMGGVSAWLWRTGGTVYWGQGASLAAAQVAPWTSIANAATLYFDSSFAGVGDTIDIILSYNQNEPTVTAGGAAGSRSMTLSSTALTLPGMFASVPLPSGHQRLFLITSIAGNVINFEPSMPESVAAGATVTLVRPCLRARLADAEFEYEDSNGTVVFVCNVEEAL